MRIRTQQTQAILLDEDADTEVEHLKYLEKSSSSSTVPFFLLFGFLPVFAPKLSRMLSFSVSSKVSSSSRSYYIERYGSQTKNYVTEIEDSHEDLVTTTTLKVTSAVLWSFLAICVCCPCVNPP